MVKKKQGSDVPNRESKRVDFKARMDLGNPGDWCEIIKDIVAIANSLGGSIFVGLNDDGSPSDWDPEPLIQLDPAQLVDKISKYTGEQFDAVEIAGVRVTNRLVAEIRIGRAVTPLVFAQPGTYETLPGKQKTAFGRGTVYFRHGAKSEPGTSRDLRQAIEHQVAELRRAWLGNIRKVVTAPTGHQVKILPPDVVQSEDQNALPVRIVDDPAAPSYGSAIQITIILIV